MFLSVTGEGQATIEIKHSVFICHVKGIESYDEGLDYVKDISKRYSDATHNCYALLTKDGRQKFSDNGEPQGTAGMPMLEVIKRQSLTDIVCVVTRYFGGIKLGAGGLVSAYSESVAEGIKQVTVIEKAESVIRDISLSYSAYPSFMRLAENNRIFLQPPDYGEEVALSFYFPKERDAEWREKEKEFFGGTVKSVLREIKFMNYKK